MGKCVLEMEMPESWEPGKCKICKFKRGSDQCRITDVLTGGTCKLNCFCPLRPVEEKTQISWCGLSDAEMDEINAKIRNCIERA